MKECFCSKEIEFSVFESIMGENKLKLIVGEKTNFKKNEKLGTYRIYTSYDMLIGEISLEEFNKHFAIKNI